MAFENERKFLLKNDNWKKGVSNKEEIHQAYVDLSKVKISLRTNILVVEGEDFKYSKPISPKDYSLLQEHLHREEKVLRVRKKADKLFLTLKIDIGVVGRQVEVEPSLSTEEYQKLLTLCNGFITKVRHYVKVGDFIFEIDVFTGNNIGLTLAEVEFEELGTVIPLPEWIGEEVTGQGKYYNSELAKN